MKVHFIGIGGTGLSAIARLLLEKGYSISGSDRTASPFTHSLQEAGVTVYIGHSAENIQFPDVVVRSSAVKDDNPEVEAALKVGIPVLKRADFLGQFMKDYTGIAVAGTHGKTTTTSMIAFMLSSLGLDPSYIIGGISKDLGSNAHSGRDSGFFVIEADEYDRMFLGLLPKLIVMTNLQHDHPDCFPTPEIYRDAFYQFASVLEPAGTLIACCDDSGTANLADQVELELKSIRIYKYGIAAKNTNNQYYAENIRLNDVGGFDYTFRLTGCSTPLTQVHLTIPGEHNLLNSLAALSVVHQFDLHLDLAAAALSHFTGASRRFDLRGEPNGIAIIDDYAHHPVEIAATLQSARLRYPSRRIWAVWQPHTYSRLQALYNDFLNAFTKADHVIITDVYAAREQSTDFSIAKLAKEMNHQSVRFIPALKDVSTALMNELKPGDVVLVLSAGDADSISTTLLSGLSSPCKNQEGSTK